MICELYCSKHGAFFCVWYNVIIKGMPLDWIMSVKPKDADICTPDSMLQRYYNGDPIIISFHNAKQTMLNNTPVHEMRNGIHIN